ncbi:MAG: NYN domain-containing protein [Candidatus Cloacimonetes bacterium]|nr:NYN domain-containing protein [Candidatus Cloacimonadota bacterium]
MSGKHKEQKVGVFVDVANMYHSAKNLYSGAKVNFAKVLRAAIANRRLIRAFAYVITADLEPEQAFYGALEKQGYEVRAKELQVFFGGAKKGDWDVGLCLDAIRLAPKIDVLVLVSGDGDFKDLLDYMRGQGIRTEIIAFGKTTSKQLIEESDEFLDMDENPQLFLRNAVYPKASSRK